MANHKNSNVDLLYDIEHDILTWQCFCKTNSPLSYTNIDNVFYISKHMYHMTNRYNKNMKLGIYIVIYLFEAEN